MTMPPRDEPQYGKRPGALTAGEARTCAGMIAGISPEPTKAFVLVSVIPCPVCGTHDRFSVDKDVPIDDALFMLVRAINLLTQRLEDGDQE